MDEVIEDVTEMIKRDEQVKVRLKSKIQGKCHGAS